MEPNVRFSGPWYVVRVDISSHDALESHSSEASAQKAVLIVNEHSIRNNLPHRYEVIKRT